MYVDAVRVSPHSGSIMKPAICTSFDYTLPFPEAMAVIRAAGFEVVALGGRPGHSGYAAAEGRAAIRTLLKQHGMAIDSVHAPFPEGDRLFWLDDADRAESVRLCQLAMDAAVELESQIVVIHLIQPYGIPEGDVRNRMIEQGRRSVEALADYAGRSGVKLAMENGQKHEYDDVLTTFLNEFTDPHVGFCYDSGHEHVKSGGFEMLEQFGHRLLTVHLHDNDGTKDAHVLPWEGTTDWERFRDLFHGLDYRGNLLLETDIGNSRFKDPAVFLSQAMARAERLLRVSG